jgi:hypothetical protein
LELALLETELKKINAAEQFNREKREQQGLGLGLYLQRQLQRKQMVFLVLLPRKTKALLFQ